MVIQDSGNTVTRCALHDQGRQGADQHVAAFTAARQLEGGYGLQFQLFQQAGVGLAHHQPQACEQGHHVDREGHAEGVAPAPFHKLFVAQRLVEVGKQCRCHHKAQRGAQLADHGIPAALFGWGAQCQQRRQAIPGAAQGQPLQDAEQHQQGDGIAAQVNIAGQQCHAHRGGSQQEQRDGQLGGTAPALLDDHGDGGADGAGDEGQREHGKRRQHAVEQGVVGEEHVREHQHAGNAEDEEVEILGRSADDDAGSDFAGRSLFVPFFSVSASDRSSEPWKPPAGAMFG